MRHIRQFIVLCAILTLFTLSARAYSPELSQGQENIVKRARQLSEIEWTPMQDIYQWNYAGTFKAGTTYTGVPYGQPVNTGGYIGWNVSLDSFLDFVSDNTSKLYSAYSWYNKIAPYYSTDCSGYVSYAWQTKVRLTTNSLPDYAEKVAWQSVDAIEVGDALNLVYSHVVLVSAVDLDADGRVAGVQIMEATPSITQTTGYGTLGPQSLEAFRSRYFDRGYVLYRNPNRDSVTYTHSCAVPIDGDYCSSCEEAAPSASIQVTATGRRLTLSHENSGAAIYYTTDGSTPTTASSRYTGPLDFSSTTTVKAIAVTNRFSSQRVLVCRVAIESASAPIGKLSSGLENGSTVSRGSTLTLSTATDGAVICYTTDGSTPTASSSKYTGGITIDRDMTIKAIALKDGYAASSVSVFSFTVADVHSIQVSASAGGSVSPRGTTQVLSGSSLTVKFTPDSGCVVDAVTVDGSAVGAPGQYSFTDIRSDHTVYVKFRDNTSLPFTDVSSGAWYRPAVSYVYKNGLYNGTAASAFSPETAMTRGMFATVLSRLAGVPAALNGELAVVGGTEVRLRAEPNTTSAILGYFDLYDCVAILGSSGDWYQISSGDAIGWIRGDLLWIYDGRITDLKEGQYYTNAVKWACVMGIAGSSGGNFRAEDSILRQEMAAMLYNYARANGISLPTGSSDSFTDDGKIADYARNAVYALKNAGIISGMGDGSFAPSGTATRAQVAQIFLNFHDQLD